MSSAVEFDQRFHEEHFRFVLIPNTFILDVTEWLFNNENDAAKVVQIWSDVFVRGMNRGLFSEC